MISLFSNTKTKIISFYKKICRMCFWAWHMRDNYDWDYGYLEQMLLLKLKRMKHCMDTEPYHMNINDLKEYLADPNTHKYNKDWAHGSYRAQKALVYVITLLERLCNDVESEYYDKKVGLIEHRDSVDIKLEYLFDKERQNCDQAFWDKTFDLMKKSEKLKERDRRKAYQLIAKYGSGWWT